VTVSTEEIKKLEEQVRQDRKLIRRAEQTLAEISRTAGLSDDHADVLAALRIRLEGKERGSLEDLLSAAGELSGKRDLSAALEVGEEKATRDWPEVKEESRDWPGL
jgi:hypothetical protein